MQTFSIQTLGCRVNHYESEQIATLLRSRGWTEAESGPADLRIINTCSVTVEAASKSRQSTRRALKLNVLGQARATPVGSANPRGKVIVTGCWATSDFEEARSIAGVHAVITHHENVADRLQDFLDEHSLESEHALRSSPLSPACGESPRAELKKKDPKIPVSSKSSPLSLVLGGEGQGKGRLPNGMGSTKPKQPRLHRAGTHSLPLLGQRQTHHQRAFLKIQDGCDAHCTYCIIPRLRPALWSKPRQEAVEEAKRLVAAGHLELVLTGIFIGAYSQPTTLRRRQSPEHTGKLAHLIDDLCTQVPGLLRLRLSSIEPGDLGDDLLSALKSHPQVVPHFHLPLQSGSPEILRRMNRQYTRDDYLRLIDRITASFDRPALTTDIIVGFPGESDADFQQTVQVANHARFIHIHAFGYSPRPQTAAARWTENVANGTVVRQRIEVLQRSASTHSQTFRESFLGQTVKLLVERPNENPDNPEALPSSRFHHGRCERYFDVHFESPTAQPGNLVEVRIERVSSLGTFGSPTSERPLSHPSLSDFPICG